MGKSLTIENLQRIYNAMLVIREIDRSIYFNNYLKELEWRMSYLKELEELTKNV